MQSLIHDAIQWDVRNWSACLPFWEAHLPRGRELSALTLGERHGGLTLWFAWQGHRVTCTDLRGATPQAHALHARYGVEGRITYRTADVTRLEFSADSFDVVALKSVLGAVGTRARQQQAIGEMHRVLKPGGLLLLAENLQGTWLHRALRRRFVAWSANWRYLDSRTDRQLFDRFAQSWFQTHGVVATFGRTERQRTALSWIDRWLSPLVPASRRYILFAVCRK